VKDQKKGSDMLYAEHKIANWEDKLIERRDFWIDCAVGVKPYDGKSGKIACKSMNCESRKTISDFLDSGKRTKSFDYETTREASKAAYKFENTVERYLLNVKVKQNGNRVTLTRARFRG